MGRRLKKDSYREEARKAAKQLGYGTQVIADIINAKDDDEIRRIMTTARWRKFKDE